MKKLLIVLLLVSSLFGSKCELYYGKYKEQVQLLQFALDKRDKYDMVRFGKSSLQYAEYSIVYCKNDALADKLNEAREIIKKIIAEGNK